MSVVHPEDQLLALFKLCGCINPHAAEVLLDCLKFAAMDKDKDWPKFVRDVFDGYDSHAYIAMNYLEEHLGFIEHGSGIRYPWLTGEGMDAMAKAEALIKEAE